MRRLSLLLLLLAAGCGVSGETGAPGSSEPVSSGATAPGTTIEKTPLVKPNLQPPPLVLVSSAGKQYARPGSSCIQYTDPDTGAGSGVCSDAAGPLHPESVSVVQPGERVLVLLAGGYVISGSVSVRPLGCAEKESASFDLAHADETHWQVRLDPGAYQLDVFAQFSSNDGREGDVSGSFGLLVGGRVKEHDYTGIVGVEPPMLACQVPA